MRLFVRILLGTTAVASLVVLGLSVWPGVLADVLLMSIFLAVIWVPVMVIAIALTAGVLHTRYEQGRLSRASTREWAAIPAIALVALALLFIRVPCRIAFFASRADFAAIVDGPPQAGGVRRPLGARLGFYWVDEYAVDWRGGIFFRVHAGADGIGPDVMSYGFVRRPNLEGTPFGAADYSLSHLSGDWYLFRTSDDWY